MHDDARRDILMVMASPPSPQWLQIKLSIRRFDCLDIGHTGTTIAVGGALWTWVIPALFMHQTMDQGAKLHAHSECFFYENISYRSQLGRR
jgi:hypothetical protein